MKKGLVLGKFMPLHVGHIALIDFALKHCDSLYVVMCFTKKEPISGSVRKQWLKKALEKRERVILIPFGYNENELPNTSISSPEVSQRWSEALVKLVPDADVLFTSEDYGTDVARFMGIDHILFDKSRALNPISATQIRNNPLNYWSLIADEAKPYFVKKIAILGSESTGKSTLTEKLASHYQTVFVPEVGREIVAKTEACTFDDLIRIAAGHAEEISQKICHANKLLFIDTDINITKSYSSFLFKRVLNVPRWVEDINKSDLYLFLETDCPYIQDGTRINEERRDELSKSHKNVLAANGVQYVSVGGSWENRFVKACEIVDSELF